MANDLNMWIGIGRLGRDPEVKYLANGDAVCNISIAVGKSWTDKNTREKKESTVWVPISFFGKTAEIVGEYCRKGSQVQVSGEFNVRKYTDKDGNEKYQTDIRGDRIQLLGGKPDGAQGGGAPAQQRQAAPAQRSAPAARPASGFDDASDDIPF